MKFECDSCHASYMIADEKIGKRGVKVKCKRCSHVIIVRPEKSAAPSDSAALEAAPDANSGVADQEVQGTDALSDVGDVDAASDRNAHDTSTPSEEENGNDTVTMSAQERAALTELEMARAREDKAGGPLDEGDGPTVATTTPLSAAAPMLDDDGGAPWSSGSDKEDEAPEPPSGIEAATAVGAVPGWKMEGASDGDTEIGATLSASMPDVTVPAGAPDIAGLTQDHAGDAPQGFSGLEDAPVASASTPSYDHATHDDVPAPPAYASAPELDVKAPPESGVDLLDAQIAGAFSDMFGALPDPDSTPVPPPPMFDDVDNRGPTRVLDLARVDALRAAAIPSVLSDEEDALDQLRTDLGGRTDSGDGLDPFSDDGALPAVGSNKRTSAPRAHAPDDSGGWHVAIDDEDVGPLRPSELVERIEDGRAEPDALVWRTGMSDWTPANETPDVIALMKARPMPKIPTPGFENSGFDVGDPIDDRRSSSNALSDPFSVVGDASDPNWRPHGLTEVYQAANLAEVAAGARGGGGLATPPIRRDEPPDESDAGWQPSAASALASLVADEIKRIDSGPAVVEEPQYPALSDDIGFGRSLAESSGSNLGSPLLGMSDIPEAAPAARYPTMGVQSAALPSLDSYPPMQAPLPYAAAAPARSPLIYAAGGAIALVLVIIAAALVKMAFIGPSPPVAVVDPRTVASTDVATNPAAVPTEKPATPDPAPAGGQNAPDTSPPPNPEPKPADAPTNAAAGAPGDTADVGGAEKKDEPSSTKPVEAKPDPKPRVAKDDRPTSTREPSKPSKPDPKPEKPVQTASAAPSKPIAETPKPKATPKGCDPVLDFDCDEKKASGGSASSSKKATLSKADVFEVVKKNIAKINACGKTHNVKGTVKVEWEVLKSGRTSSVRVADPAYAGTPVGRCMVTEIQRWIFPAYTGAAPPPIKFPFKLG